MKQHEEWLKKADSDLASCKVLLNSLPPILDTCVYHAQQCAEKSLKAFLVLKTGRFIKKHDLTYLLTECSAIDPDFDNFADESDILAPYDTAYRYPGLSENFEPEYSEAEEAFFYAKNILDFVKSKIFP